MGWLVVLIGLGGNAAAIGQTHILDFSGADDLSAWKITGNVTIDDQRTREGSSGSMKIAPGAKAVWTLRDTDGAGVLDLWVYDDITIPAQPKTRRIGPRWGLVAADGTVLAVGALYAPYLAGDKTYCTTEYTGETWFKVSYLGECRRSEGWHRWTFRMDPQKGLSIAFDGKDVNAKRQRFEWNKTRFEGFAGVAVFGDQVGGEAQTIWVDDLSVELAGAMQARPTPPEPVKIVPDEDPAEKNPPALLDEAMSRHPRLLFGPEDLPRLRRFAKGEGKRFFDELVSYRASCKPPERPGWLRNATDGQRIGLWRMPTVALHYLLTGDRSSFNDAVGYMELLLRLPHWETGKERDSGMSSANVMIGAALAYDWLHDDLDPDFRERFRRKLLHMARAQYYGGHLNRNKATGYWQGDPANNHRWHRDAGMVLAVLAAYEGDAADDWILARCFEEMALITRWLPPDGTSHEGPGYLIFGGAHLTLACQAADRCFGTDSLQHAFFRNAPRFRLHTVAPGFEQSLHFGDSGGMGNYSNFLYKAAAVHDLRDAQDGLVRLERTNPKAWWLGWMSLVWFDPDLTPGDVTTLRPNAFFPDLGLAVMRDRWDAGGVAAMFKCGPFGGYTLNAYRNANEYKYVNVAHDDPDAASFTIFAGGEHLAETDRYSKHKQSSNHNTVLINGVGQTVAGRKEGGVWSQPGRGDMTDMAVVTAFKDAGEIVVVDGEAGGSYPAIKGARPALRRFRRTFIWVRGKYILVLDDVRAPEPVEIAWLMQGPQLKPGDADAGRYVLAANKTTCPFRVITSTAMDASIGESTADHRGKPLGWRQLRLETTAPSARFVSVYDPWDTGADPEVDFADKADAKVVVRGRGFEDIWQWRPAEERFAPTYLRATRGRDRLITLDAKDRTSRPK
jgi:hypothetical protein